MQLPVRSRWNDPAILWSVGVTLATLVFGRFQNEGHLVGGEISLAKTLWLSLTILVFLVLPGLLWRDRRVDARLRPIFGFIFASFVVRAAVELPILYMTDWWKCSYGIAHDLTTAGVAAALYFRSRGSAGSRSRYSGFLWLILALLLVEAAFANAFCSIADPGSGTYFASDEATFRTINRATWLAVTSGYSFLIFLLWRTSSSRGVAPRGGPRPRSR